MNRRSFLAGLGALGASALVPRLSLAQNKPPKRFVVVFSPNGTIYDAWKPTGTETSFTFGPILAPLEPFKSKVLVLDGIDAAVAGYRGNGPGDDHSKGMGCMLTGIQLLPGPTSDIIGLGGGISIDQAIANSIGTSTRFKSLEFGVFVQRSDIFGRMIYSGPNQPLPPMEVPLSAYQRIFSGATADQAKLARLVKRRQSVLDASTASLSKLSSRIGGADRVRVDAHAESVRQIERQLVQQATACLAPTVGNLNQNDPRNYRPTGRLMMDMLAASLACDQTRVASLQWSSAVSDMTFPDLGLTRGHHDMSHDDDNSTEARNGLIAINNWYATEFAYLLAKLDAVQESDGSTLLDNTAVLWVNELAKGNEHSHNPLPVVIAGKAGGALHPGRYIKTPDLVDHNNVLIALANAVGAPMTTFGDPSFCSSPMTGL